MSGRTHAEVGRAVILAALLGVVAVTTPATALAETGSADTLSQQADEPVAAALSENSTTSAPSAEELATDVKTERAAARRATNLGPIPVAALGAGTGIGIGLLLGTLTVFVRGDER